MADRSIAWQRTAALAVVTVAAHVGTSAQSLAPLPQADAASLFRRVPGCDVRVVAGDTLIAAVALGAWVMYRNGERTVEAPVVFRDRGERAAEVRFSVTSADGGSQRGVLEARGADKPCDQGSACVVVPARLTIRQIRADGSALVLHDGDVSAIDPCGGDRATRLFRTTSWWEKLLRWSAGH